MEYTYDAIVIGTVNVPACFCRPKHRLLYYLYRHQPGSVGMVIDLGGFSFKRKRYWHEQTKGKSLEEIEIHWRVGNSPGKI